MTPKTSDPTLVYQEQLQEIGQMLYQARLQRGGSLDAMAEMTLIRPSLLRAMETGTMEALPEPVYIRGLLRRYADCLGLDGEALASQFFAPPPRRPSWQSTPAAQLRPLHLYGAYLLVIMMAISGLSYFLKRTTPSTSVLPPLELQGEGQRSDLEQGGQAGPSGLAELPAELSPVPRAPVEVDVTLTGQSWMRVILDGDVEFEGMLQSGDTRQWQADETLTIRAGNAGAVVVSFNQGQAQALGEPGTVKEVTYAPETALGLLPGETLTP